MGSGSGLLILLVLRYIIRFYVTGHITMLWEACSVSYSVIELIWDIISWKFTLGLEDAVERVVNRLFE